MLLAIDIGNTDIKIGLFKGEKAFCNWRLVTDKGATLKQYKKLLRRLFTRQKVKNANIDEIIICSVVPNLTKIFKKALFLLLKIKPLILGKDIVAPIKNLYRRPEQVGQDRLANAAAAFSKYGGPVIVVDFGTALTFDLVTAQGSYLGGVIVPGMEVSLKALTRAADLLPEIGLGRPRALLGRETASSMRSGLVYGYSFLVEGMLQQLKKELKSRPYVVATGGKASLMSHYCRSIDRINENLTLEGLLKTALQRRKQTKRLKR
ncbi:MAG: type III pantothenate kinase [Candidatus Omnitrophica bacterium]|nr:type III pantothenate kinase [Candidatus Omnitrophota bacterium]